MAITYERNQTFTVPVVDISSYLRDPNSPQADAVVEEIRVACSTSGFFQIVGHGIPKSLQLATLEAAKAFFALPQDEKTKLTGTHGRGYELLGSQVLEAGKKPDLKEGFMLGREVPKQPPFKPFREPNIWPSCDVISESQFKEPLLAYHEALTQLSSQVMHILARGIKGFAPSLIEEFNNDPIASVRLLHYPPHPKSNDNSLVGAGAHTDFGGITLLLQDVQSGLQVLNQETNEWIDVPPQSDAYVVNIGDLLETWTSGKYKSNLHRVVNRSGTDRYSIPFFYDGYADCVIRPVDGSKAKEFTVQEHLQTRYRASYPDS